MFSNVKSNLKFDSEISDCGSQLEFDGIHLKIDEQNVIFDHVFTSAADYLTIWESEIQKKLITWATQGMNTAVVVFGTSASSKRAILEADDGLILATAEEIFIELKQDQYDSFNVEIQYCEIFNDLVFDLLDPENTENLSPEETTDGFLVPNLTRIQLSGPEDFERWFKAGKFNRTTSSCDLGMHAEYASCFLSFKLASKYSDPKKENWVSNFTFVELPGAEKIWANSRRLSEGRLNDECKAVSNFVSALATGSEIYIDAAKTTLLLGDIFGGNCETLVITCVDPQNIEDTKKVVKFSQQFGKISNTPLVNTDSIRGYLQNIHSENKKLRRQAEVIELEVGKAQKNLEHDLTKKVLELKQTLLDKDEEILKLNEVKNEWHDRHGQFQRKYEANVNELLDLKNSLVGSEKLRLEITKALLDCQLKKNEMTKKHTEELCTFDTKLLTLEREVTEKEISLGLHEQRVYEYKIKCKNGVNGNKDLLMEVALCKQANEKLKKNVELENQRYEDLNLQLINMINSNGAMEEAKANLQEESLTFEKCFEIEMKKSGKLTEAFSELKTKHRDLQTDFEIKKNEVFTKDVELNRLKTELESLKNEFNKKWIDLKTQSEDPMSRLKIQIEELVQENNQLEKEGRICNQKFVSSKGTKVASENELKIAQNDIKNLKVDFTKKFNLFQKNSLLHLESVEQLGRKNCTSEGKILKQKIYQQLIEFHRVHEKYLIENNEIIRLKNRKISEELIALHEICQVQDQHVRALEPNTKLATQGLLESLAKEAKRVAEEAEEREKTRVRETGELSRMIDDQKEESIQNAEYYQASVKTIQRELIQLKRVLKEEHSHCGRTKTNRKERERLKELQGDLLGKLDRIPEQVDQRFKTREMLLMKSERSAKVHDRVESMRRSTKEMYQQITSLKAKLGALEEKANDIQKQGTKKEVAQLKERIDMLKREKQGMKNWARKKIQAYINKIRLKEGGESQSAVTDKAKVFKQWEK